MSYYQLDDLDESIRVKYEKIVKKLHDYEFNCKDVYDLLKCEQRLGCVFLHSIGIETEEYKEYDDY